MRNVIFQVLSYFANYTSRNPRIILFSDPVVIIIGCQLVRRETVSELYLGVYYVSSVEAVPTYIPVSSRFQACVCSLTRHQEPSKSTYTHPPKTRYYTHSVSTRVISTNTNITQHIYEVAQGCSRFNVRCLIRCIYLPLQPGSRHSPFTPGGIHKSNKKDRSGRMRRRRDACRYSCLFTRAAAAACPPMSFANLLLFPDR